ncbi:Uncharacterized protein DAT39_002381, partial [Clarias magur]
SPSMMRIEDDSSSIITSFIEESSTEGESFISNLDESVIGSHSTPKTNSTRSSPSSIAMRCQTSPTEPSQA